MGLAKRIIPVLLSRDGNLVKGKQFDSSRVVGNVQQAAEIHQARGVDELLILDVAATPDGRGPDLMAVAKLTECCFMPVTVGGGVTSMNHVRQLLARGADKVVIGTAAVENPWLGKECANKFGSQAIVVAVDVAYSPSKHWQLTSCCGSIAHDEKVLDFAVKMAQYGAGELILTNIHKEGMMKGYDLRLIHAVSECVNVPIIASGGCGSYLHMDQALKAGANAVAAGSLFQFTEATPKGAAEYLAKRKWETRL